MSYLPSQVYILFVVPNFFEECEGTMAWGLLKKLNQVCLPQRKLVGDPWCYHSKAHLIVIRAKNDFLVSTKTSLNLFFFRFSRLNETKFDKRLTSQFKK